MKWHPADPRVRHMSNREKAAEAREATKGHPCVSCGVEPGQRCVTSGGKRRGPHFWRRVQVRKGREPPDA